MSKGDMNDVFQDVAEINPGNDSDNDSQEYLDALDRQMQELELEGRDIDFKFKSVEEAKEEIERVGEEFLSNEEAKAQANLNPDAEKAEPANVKEVEPDEDDETVERKTDQEQEEDIRRKREDAMSETELQDLLAKAESKKQDGNALYLDKKYDEAVQIYSDCLELCPLKFQEKRAIYYGNRAAAKVFMDLKEEALADCHTALELKPDYVKTLARRGQIYEDLDKPHEALKDFEKVLEYDKEHREARAAMRRLPAKVAQKDEEIKAEMFGNLRKLGNMVLNPFGLSVDNFQFEKSEDTGSYSVKFKQNNPES